MKTNVFISIVCLYGIIFDEHLCHTHDARMKGVEEKAHVRLMASSI